MKKDLDMDLGKLVALKLFNRDELAERLSISRPNLISAFKGRRLLPQKYFTHLAEILNLDSKVKFKANTFHTLTVNNASKQYFDVYDVLYIFSRTPLSFIAVLNTIGERKNGYAYVLKDKKNCYIIVRDDEKMLSYYDEENHFTEADKSFKKLFKIENYQKIREISLPNFEVIMANKISLDKLLDFINKENTKVWTWELLKKQAQEKQYSTNEIAKMLGFEE